MSFGKKGLASGQVAPAPGGFGRAAAPAGQAVAQSARQSSADELAAKREAFVASEQARRKSEVGEITPASQPSTPEDHDPLINLRNMSRTEPRAAQPLGDDAAAREGTGAGFGGGPIGASGLSTAQEAEIRAAARGMARNKPARYGSSASSQGGGGSGSSSGSGYIFGDPHSRNIGLAYVLWFVLGQLSMHRFYCGQKDTAFIQLALWIGSLVVLFIFPPVGLLGLLIWVCWLFGDLFMIPGMLRKFQAEHDYRGVFA